MAASNQTIPRLNPGPPVAGAACFPRAAARFALACWLACAVLAAGIPAAAQEVASGESLSVLTYLEPYRSIEMSPAESGVIREILVKEGDRVREGQPLLKLDAETIEARLAVALAQADNMGGIHAAESEHKLQKERYEKLASLETRDVSSQFEVQRALATMKAAEGRLTEALEQKRVYQLLAEQARAELDRRQLRSPIDGIVVEITRDLAEPVSAPESSREGSYLVRVVRVDRLQAVAHLPGEWAGRVSEGDELELAVETPGGGGPPQRVRGEVEFASPVIDSASNTVRVRLAVDNTDGQIRAGSPARLIVPASRAQAAATAPQGIP